MGGADADGIAWRCEEETMPKSAKKGAKKKKLVFIYRSHQYCINVFVFFLLYRKEKPTTPTKVKIYNYSTFSPPF